MNAEKLTALLRDYGAMAIAFSGGVDSTLLARAAIGVLGKSAVLLLFADTAFVTAAERVRVRELAAELGAELQVVPLDPLSDATIAANPKERCYFCKKLLMTALREQATAAGLTVLADGANTDDCSDYRPGLRAAAELGVRHPLMEAGLAKADIRVLARSYGLTNADLPAAACLASRIPPGTAIRAERLRAIERAEAVLQELGFSGVRVRDLQGVAKIELRAGDMERFWPLRDTVSRRVRLAGFKQAAMDLDGYKQGALNEL